jgi:hypothetical protein
MPVFPASRVHIDRLSTDIGVMQHAEGARPDPAHGYCTDDIARSLLVDVAHHRSLGWAAVATSAARNMAFLEEAFDEPTGRFRNFRNADGSWLDAPGSEDANARALLALATFQADAPSGHLTVAASRLLERGLPRASLVQHLRPKATVVLACDAAIRSGASGEVELIAQRVGNELRLAFESRLVTWDWPWPEPLVTYENELLAQALLVGGRLLGYPRMTRTGFRVLDWLIDAQTTDEGLLRCVGNRGWWPHKGVPATYEQQPISATSMVLAAAAASEASGSSRYAEAMEMAYAWFLGHNDQGLSLVDPDAGSCHDGLVANGLNANQGAESTLVWHLAAERVRVARSGAASTAPAAVDVASVAG